MVLIADKRPRLTSRHFNDIQTAVRKIQSLECSLQGNAISEGMQIYSEWGGTVAHFLSNEEYCGLWYTDGAIGLTKNAANTNFDLYGGDVFIEPLIEKYPILNLGYCDVWPQEDSVLLIPDQADWNVYLDSECPNFIGTEPDSNFTEYQFSARPFIIDQIERLTKYI